MIYSTCVFVYCLYECFKQENSISLFPIALLLIFSVTVTVVYLQWKEPVFHQVMYGALVACLVMRSIFIVTWVYPWLRPLCYTSLGVFLLGFLLWNIDNIFCDTLRASRHTLPPGVGVATQFHAWWHIFTGLGSYLHILLSLQIRSTYLKYRPKVKFLCGVWPTLHIEPQKTSWNEGMGTNFRMVTTISRHHQHTDLPMPTAGNSAHSKGAGEPQGTTPGTLRFWTVGIY